MITDPKGQDEDLEFIGKQIDIGIENTEILKKLTKKEMGLYRLKLYNDVCTLHPKDENTVSIVELEKEWLILEQKLKSIQFNVNQNIPLKPSSQEVETILENTSIKYFLDV